MLTESEMYHEKEEYKEEKITSREQLERQLVDRVKFIEHDGEKTNHR